MCDHINKKKRSYCYNQSNEKKKGRENKLWNKVNIMLILILNLFNFELFFYLLFLISYLLTCLTAFFDSAPRNHHCICYARNVLQSRGAFQHCVSLLINFHVHWTFQLWTVKIDGKLYNLNSNCNFWMDDFYGSLFYLLYIWYQNPNKTVSSLNE